PEKLRRVRLGLAVGRMKRAGQYTGLVVDSVSRSSPADEKGVSAGDILLEIDGRKLTSVLDFYIQMMDKQIGEPIEIEYVKPQMAPLRARSVKLTMQARPLPDGRKLVSDFFQMEVAELTQRVARRFGFDSAYPILIVTGVDPKGAAAARLAQGDLILQINNATVSNIRELSLEMEKVNEGDLVQIRIMRISVGLFGQVQRPYRVRLRAKRIRTRTY
ncbi:MAG: PDZ domain-containing protein, partial [Planctomycetota bacterium]